MESEVVLLRKRIHVLEDEINDCKNKVQELQDYIDSIEDKE